MIVDLVLLAKIEEVFRLICDELIDLIDSFLLLMKACVIYSGLPGLIFLD
jgi:hypothetical protein